MKLIYVFIIIVILISLDLKIRNQTNDKTLDEICEIKGLDLKTSSYDVKKKRFVIYCE